MTNEILIYNENKDFPIPERKYDSVGYDLYCSEDKLIMPHTMADIATGVYLGLPSNVWAMLVNRSSTFRRKLIMPVSIIDPGFIGELKICVLNMDEAPYLARKGERLGQFIPMLDVPNVNLRQVDNKTDLPRTNRGDKGYGSTGY